MVYVAPWRGSNLALRDLLHRRERYSQKTNFQFSNRRETSSPSSLVVERLDGRPWWGMVAPCGWTGYETFRPMASRRTAAPSALES